jgi:hypothetical protein
MTRVCLVGKAEVNLQYELLSRETAREALSTYDIREPYENAVGIETVSLGAAVALLNDLDWYLVRFVDEAMVLEPSVSEDEWLSRDLAAAVRDDELAPGETERFIKLYGLEAPSDADSETDDGDRADGNPTGDGTAEETTDTGGREGPRRLVEPMYVTRTGDGLPSYDLRDVEETLVERVTEAEFGA